MDSAGDYQVVQEFLIESYENLDHRDCELVALESNPGDRKALASIFRTIHTIKGTCGFLRFLELEKLLHLGENLPARLRDGELQTHAGGDRGSSFHRRRDSSDAGRDR